MVARSTPAETPLMTTAASRFVRTTLFVLCSAAVGFVAVDRDLVGTVWHQVASAIEREAPPSASRPDAPHAPAVGGGLVALSAGRSGHFDVQVLVNGTHVEMLADTGATWIALTAEDASRLGFKPETLTYSIPTQTANGIVHKAPVILDRVTVGPITVRNVKAAVSPPGVLPMSLLGMSFIGSLSRFEVKGDQLVLHR